MLKMCLKLHFHQLNAFYLLISFIVLNHISRFEIKHNATEAIDEIYDDRRYTRSFFNVFRNNLDFKIRKYSRFLKKSDENIRQVWIMAFLSITFETLYRDLLNYERKTTLLEDRQKRDEKVWKPQNLTPIYIDCEIKLVKSDSKI